MVKYSIIIVDFFIFIFNQTLYTKDLSKNIFNFFIYETLHTTHYHYKYKKLQLKRFYFKIYYYNFFPCMPFSIWRNTSGAYILQTYVKIFYNLYNRGRENSNQTLTDVKRGETTCYNKF